MRCNHQWSEECYDVVPSQVCGRCNAWRIEEEQDELIRDAYRRGAEAMRAQVMDWLVQAQAEATVIVVDTAIRGVHKLPIPEER